jgi:hypothetical protein
MVHHWWVGLDLSLLDDLLWILENKEQELGFASE